MFLDGQIVSEMVAHGIQMLMTITVIGMEEKTQVPMGRQPTMLVAFVGVDKHKQASVNLDLTTA